MNSSWIGPKTEVAKIKDREIPLLTSAKCWTPEPEEIAKK